MDSTQKPSQGAHQNHSCARCSERKVKCDRKLPCGACTRLSLECVFVPLPPRNRHRRRVNNNAQVQLLTDRLRKYEAWFQEKGIDLDHLPAETLAQTQDQRLMPPQPSQSIQSPLSTASHSQGPKFANNVLWTRVIEEFDSQDDPDATLDGSSDPGEVEDDSRDTQENSNGGPFFIFGGQLSHRPSHPPPETARRLWQVYCENVDPLTKLLHVPTIQHALDKALDNLPAVPRVFESLLFAIYAAAVMSLGEEECQQRLGEPRTVLLSQYLAATETALTEANVLGTTDIVVLQALLLYLLAIRDLYEPRAVWTLTGVAMRLAESMGLDRDGMVETSPPMSPFEIEMRRRLWWQLRMHDFRTAELCGRPKFQDLDMDSSRVDGSMPTQWPANVDDTILRPDMPGPPLPPLGEASSATDAVFVAVKCELLRFTAARLSTMKRQQTLSNANPWDLYTVGPLDNNYRDLEAYLETRYLRYCDPSQPLHLMATLMVRCAINILRFMARHPRRWTDYGVLDKQNNEERAVVWRLCLTILDQQHMLQSNPHLRCFAWHAPFFQQWHAIIHVLDTLRADPGIEHAERAWGLIEKTYANNLEMLSGSTKKPIHVAVANLCLKAFAQHEALTGSREATPPFITQLRKARERTRRKTAEMGSLDTSKQTHELSNKGSNNVSGNIRTNDRAGASDFDLFVDMGTDPEATVDWNQWDAWLVGAGA